MLKENKKAGLSKILHIFVWQNYRIMKTKVRALHYLLTTLVFFMMTGIIELHAQSNDRLVMSGQDCADFIWFRKGSTMEYEVTDGKGKSIQKSKMHVKDIQHVSKGAIATIQVSTGEDMDFEIQYKCIDQNLYMDFGAMIKSAMKSSGAKMEDLQAAEKIADDISIETNGFVSFPKNMSVGQKLDPILFTMETGNGSPLKMTFTANQHNRQVEAREKTSTPAGEFDCLRIASELNSSMKVMGMNQKLPATNEKLWFAPKIGLIKQETYNAKGKLQSTMQLVNFSY